MPEPSEKLFDEVMADARTKAERTRRRGERDAEAARKKATKEAQKAADKILDTARTEAESRRKQVLATLEIEALRDRLARLEDSLRRVRDRVDEQLRTLNPQRMGEARIRLALDALRQIPVGDVVVALPPKEHEARGHEFAAELARRAAQELGRQVNARPADRPADIASGAVLRSADGRLEVVQSLQDRLRRIWPELRLRVADTLFAQTGSGRENR